MLFKGLPAASFHACLKESALQPRGLLSLVGGFALCTIDQGSFLEIIPQETN